MQEIMQQQQPDTRLLDSPYVVRRYLVAAAREWKKLEEKKVDGAAVRPEKVDNNAGINEKQNIIDYWKETLFLL